MGKPPPPSVQKCYNGKKSWSSTTENNQEQEMRPLETELDDDGKGWTIESSGGP